MAHDLVLQTSGLTKEFGGFFAVNGVDLAVRRGTIHALIGPNGAGKTTCFNLLTKFLNPSSGTILYKGRGYYANIPGGRGPQRTCALVPDFSGVSASDRARKCPHRASATPRREFRFLALSVRSQRHE